MHLARRAHVIVLLAAVLAVIGLWYPGDFARLWRIPAGLLLLGLALEGALVRRSAPEARVLVPDRSFLGRPQPAAFAFTNRSGRELSLEYAPATPAGFEPLNEVRRVHAPARAEAQDAVTLLPVRLGP